MTCAVYIAGSSAELARCEDAVEYARGLGVTVTLDWPALVRANLAAGKSDASLTPHEAQRQALLDLRAVRDASIVVFLAPALPSRGCWVELGFAISTGVRVIASRERAACASIFERLIAWECETDRSAIALAKMLIAPKPIGAERDRA